MKMSLILSSNEVFLAKCSLYFRINLLQASEPPSEKHLNAYQKLIGSSSKCANNLCKVGVMFPHGNDSTRATQYVLSLGYNNSLLLI